MTITGGDSRRACVILHGDRCRYTRRVKYCHYKRGNGNGEKVTSRAFQEELRHKNIKIKTKNKKEGKQNNNTNRHEEL